MLPIIAVPDSKDARIVFDALNLYYTSTDQRPNDAETQGRLALLLAASYVEMTRTTDTENGALT